MQTKKIWQSKTVWLNLIALILTISGLFTPETLAMIGIENTGKFLGIMGLITGILNIILRTGTPAPIDNSVPTGTDYAVTPKGREEAKNIR